MRIAVVSSVLLPFLALLASAAPFQRVVSLGDSLLDDPNGNRSPVAAAQIAARLGVPLTNYADSDAASTALIRQGQHTRAASQFGPGDLAVMWIGGNDLFWSSLQVTFGNYSFIDELADNVGTALSTLRGSGLEVLVFNLPDFAAVPAVQRTVETLAPLEFLRQEALENFTQAARFWNYRLADLAAEFDATLVDVYQPLADAVANPTEFSLLGHEPVLGPAYGCAFCLFADSIHPSAFVQGWAANAALEQLNLRYIAQGIDALPLISQAELAQLAGVTPGDFDESGLVDAADLAQWMESFSTRSPDGSPLAHSWGDADGDADVDGDDFLYWQRDFDPRTGSPHVPFASPGVVPVPEPTAGLLALAALGAAAGMAHVSRR